jgi:hypothetical protein
MCIKVESLLCHIIFLSSLGKSMRTNITWIHIILGVGTPLLESDQFIQCMQDNWFINIRDFLIQIKAKIINRGLWQPKLARVDDEFIMEMVDKLKLPNRIVIIVNNWRIYFQIWRIYFQILSMADITNAAGDRLIPTIFEKNKINDWVSTSTLKWPHQKWPPLNTFCIWKRIIRQITGCDCVGNLRTKQLGDWLPTYYQDRRINTLIHNNHESIARYCRVTQSWLRYELMDTRYSNLVFLKSTQEWQSDLNLAMYVPVDISEENIIMFTGEPWHGLKYRLIL